MLRAQVGPVVRDVIKYGEGSIKLGEEVDGRKRRSMTRSQERSSVPTIVLMSRGSASAPVPRAA